MDVNFDSFNQFIIVKSDSLQKLTVFKVSNLKTDIKTCDRYRNIEMRSSLLW